MLGEVDKSTEMAIIREVALRYPKATVTGPAAARVLGLATLAWVTSVDVIPPGTTRAKKGRSDLGFQARQGPGGSRSHDRGRARAASHRHSL